MLVVRHDDDDDDDDDDEVGYLRKNDRFTKYGVFTSTAWLTIML